MESDSDSDIEWLPDLPDDGVSLPANHRRNSCKPRKSNSNNNNNNSQYMINRSNKITFMLSYNWE